MTRTRSWPTALPFVGLALAGLFLGNTLLCADDTPAEDPVIARTSEHAPRLRSAHPGRVPRLRLAVPDGQAPVAGTGSETAAAPPAPFVPARTRLAPLVSMYDDFLEMVELDATTLRDVRRMLHRAHESILRGEQQAAQNLAERGTAQARRERALRELEAEMQREIRPEQVERVFAHPFVQALLEAPEPLFEANRRGVVMIRADLLP